MCSLSTLESPALPVLSSSWGFNLGAEVLPVEVHPNIVPFLSAVELSDVSGFPKWNGLACGSEVTMSRSETEAWWVPEQGSYLNDFSTVLPSLRREWIETERPGCPVLVSREGSFSPE